MTDRLEGTWATRDLPVLATAARLLEDRPGRWLDPSDVADEAGIPIGDVQRSFAALRGSFLDVTLSRAGSGMPLYIVTDITERGRREVGLWPDAETAVDRLLWALEQRIAEAPAEEKGKLRTFRDGVVGVGRDVAVEVLGAALTGRLPT